MLFAVDVHNETNQMFLEELCARMLELRITGRWWLWNRAFGESLHEGVFAVCGVEEKSVVGTALPLVHPINMLADDLGGYVEGALVCVCWREYWGWVGQEKATSF